MNTSYLSTISTTASSNASNSSGNPSTFESIGGSIVYGIISMVTFIANIGMFVLIIFEKKLHCVSNWIMASMFFVGTIFGLGYLLPRWALYIYINSNYIACTLLPQTGIGLIVNLNLHLCLVSFDRYFSVTYPFRYSRKQTQTIAAIAVASVWVLSFFCAYLPLFTFMELKDKCVILSSRVPTHAIYLLTIFGSLFFLPLIALIATYIPILIIVNDHTRRNEMISRRTNTPVEVIKRNIRAIKHMAVMIGIFVICWLPYVVTFLTLFTYPGAVTLQTVNLVRGLQYLAFSYPACNPLLYAYFSASLRKELTRKLSSTVFGRMLRSRSSLGGTSTFKNQTNDSLMTTDFRRKSSAGNIAAYDVGNKQVSAPNDLNRLK